MTDSQPTLSPYKVQIPCALCSRPFVQWKYNVARGRVYCSWRCGTLGRRKPIADRLRAKLAPPNKRGCLLFTGKRDVNGYGMIYTDIAHSEAGRSDHMIQAHRIAWELANGPISEGMSVLHRCDVRACCNPAHLFLGTLRDNSIDMARKNRGAKVKLTIEQVRAIRGRFALGGITQTALAKEYGVHFVTIHNIVRGKKRRHV